MNDRIRELMIEAGYAAPELAGRANKLVELIVRECIQELVISKKCDPYTGDLFECEYNTCIEEQVLVLKEHFGVDN